MILLLDTNVVSALIRRELESSVSGWLDEQDEAQLYTTVITIHEMRYGIEKLPAGRRRTTLARSLDDFLSQGFHNRILDLDFAACRASGEIQAKRSRIGKPINLADCLIAGIAVSSSAKIVTRDVTDFAGLDLDIIDPWSPA